MSSTSGTGNAVRLDSGNSTSSELVRVRNTASHDAFELQTLDQDRRHSAWQQSIWLRPDDQAIQNFNLDYLLLDRRRPTSHGS